MEPGKILEYQAVCHNCKWHGRKYGSQRAAELEIPQHKNSIHLDTADHECEVIATEVTNEHPELSKEAVKLLFIRKSAAEAYASGEIKEATKGMLIEITEIATASSMSKDELSLHIGNLDKARSFLAAFTQGLKIAQADELEPIFREKHEKEEREKRAASTTKKGDISDNLKALGLSMDKLIAFANQPNGDAPPPAIEIPKVETPSISEDEIICPKCNKATSKAFFALHSC